MSGPFAFEIQEDENRIETPFQNRETRLLRGLFEIIGLSAKLSFAAHRINGSADEENLTVNNKLCRLGFDESTASPESAQSFGWLSQNKTYWFGGGSARLIGTSRALQRGCARAPLARQAKTKPVMEAFVSFSTQTNLPPLKTTSSMFRPNPPK